MDIKLKSYRLLLTVAEERSFSRAAKRLHVAQPWVSTQIRQWEEVVGFPIFVRASNALMPVDLTERGSHLIAHVRRVLGEVDTFLVAIRNLQGTSTPLRIGTGPVSVFFTERQLLLEHMARRFPDVELQIQSMEDERTLEDLARGQLDIGIVFGSAPDETQWRRILLKKSRIDLLIPNEHRLADTERVQLADLRGEKLLAPSRSGHPLTRRCREFWLKSGVDLTDSIEPYLTATIRSAQRSRTICTTVEGTKPSDWGIADMVQRPLDNPSLNLDLTLVARRETMWGDVEKFWSVARELFGENDIMPARALRRRG